MPRETAQGLEQEDHKPTTRALRKTVPKDSGSSAPVDLDGTGAPATEGS